MADKMTFNPGDRVHWKWPNVYYKNVWGGVNDFTVVAQMPTIGYDCRIRHSFDPHQMTFSVRYDELTPADFEATV